MTKENEIGTIDKKAVGARIRLIRLELGLTLEQFGEKIDNALKSNVSKWERGESLPNGTRIRKIAKLGNVSTYYLLTGETIDYAYGGKKEIIDFDSFKSPSKLLKYIISVNGIPSNLIPELYKKGELLDDLELQKLASDYTDREIKSLSYRLSDSVLEQLLIHYKLCTLLRIKTDIEQLSSDDKYFYLSALRQEYYYDKATEKTINIDTREDFFDGETIVVNGKTLNEDDKTLLLNIINRLAD